ncbi:RIP metalloprotease RseP [Anoxybacter fermentans]|uniref:Zinc metalloprotease n=1 Tax=Anoxybacter fermentans TaxID=1323375 RepID=A0A3Q9HPC6_9FIRM|nr:RIP metalloprotease RseP [Anoxybacter fermentans]AZR72380.1 RIP metalloprotease RseP [Anoxybacter fermentans]
MLTFSLLLGATTLSKTLVTFVVVLGVLVFVHEFGHYIVAKWVGVRVEEFALGFGPKLFGYKKGETIYSLRIFPLGGFCKLTGEFPHAEEELEGEELDSYREAIQQGRALYQKSVFQRFWVIFTGPLMNFLLAVVLFTIIFMAIGVPYAGSDKPVIGNLIPNQPADQAGLKVGDLILSINGQPVKEWDDISRIINETETEYITLEIKRKEVIKKLKVKPVVEEETGRRVIGIFPQIIYRKVGIGTAIWDALRQTWFMIKGIVIGFWQMLTFRMRPDVAGPVLIAKMVGEAAEVGWVYLLRLTAIISINLGIINLIPFPALDGGRILFLGIELVRGKAVDPEKEGFVHFIGFIILMALIAIILYRDIVRIF